jgi:hypothetical protein
VINRGEAFNTDIATSPNIRHPGLLTLNVRAPLNEGWKLAMGYADDLAAIYRNETFDNLTFRAPTVRNIGPEDDGWHRVQVDCPYYRDTIH